MSDHMDKIITIGLIIAGAICAWAVLTPNHLFIG
ncbi:MAG: hypothetical protein PHN38_04950 [Sulfurospirillaceae bacterium]|nr:hypothetical protein [Sulfurospirillaceae bacterium]MDD3462708.1 hypothetical protein [Sulfurospirillaceae bacterium]